MCYYVFNRYELLVTILYRVTNEFLPEIINGKRSLINHTNSVRRSIMDLWQVLVFIIFPISSVIAMFIIKKKYLWVAPVISTVLSTLYSVLVMPDIITENEYRSMFFNLAIPIQLIICIALTVITYILSKLLDRKMPK